MARGIADRIEHALDASLVAQQRETLQIGFAARGEAWQPEGGGEVPIGIAEDRKRQPKARDQLALIFRGLTAQPEQSQAQFGKLGRAVAKTFELRGRAVGA